MAHNYTAPSRLARVGYRLAYDPLRAGYLRRLVTSLGLTGTEHVLDFGSGAGSEAAYLARALDRGGLLTCLDVSPAWLAEARRRLRHLTNVQFLLGEAPSLALPDAEFDVILAHFVLHDVDRAALPATLAALTRSLKADGRFVVVEPDTESGARKSHVSSHHHLSADDLRAAMAAASLVEQSREVVRPPFGLATKTVFRRADG